MQYARILLVYIDTFKKEVVMHEFTCVVIPFYSNFSDKMDVRLCISLYVTLSIRFHSEFFLFRLLSFFFFSSSCVNVFSYY